MDLTDRSFVTDALEETWGSLLEATEGLSAEQWQLPTDCPGWSVADQLAHLIGIERTLLGQPAPEVEVVERSHLKNPLGEINEVWIVALRELGGEELRAAFAEVTEERLAVLRALPDDAFDAVGWSPIGEVPMRTFMLVRIMDSWMHEQDVRIALGRPGGRNGAGEAVALYRADAALGMVVGKGAGATEGQSVAFEVTGPIGGRRRIEVVDGRATSVEGPDATATITLSQEAYERRFGGRSSVEACLAAVGSSISGDESLARAALAALSVVP